LTVTTTKIGKILTKITVLIFLKKKHCYCGVCVVWLGMICFVVAIFFWVGWELGAVEAISLSILVGSSVDYCVHVIEGYLLAGRSPPLHVLQVCSSSNSCCSSYYSSYCS